MLAHLRIWIRVRNGCHELIVKVLIHSIEHLLDEIELATSQLHFDELIVHLVLLEARLRTSSLNREVEQQHLHVEHILILLRHIFPGEDLM